MGGQISSASDKMMFYDHHIDLRVGYAIKLRWSDGTGYIVPVYASCKAAESASPVTIVWAYVPAESNGASKAGRINLCLDGVPSGIPATEIDFAPGKTVWTDPPAPVRGSHTVTGTTYRAIVDGRLWDIEQKTSFDEAPAELMNIWYEVVADVEHDGREVLDVRGSWPAWWPKQ
jgi:hypothetical protein